MTFDDVLAQVLEILRQQGRVSYAALKRRFDLDDAYLDDLKTELIDAQRLAQDEAGRVLVWRGSRDAPPERSHTPPAVPDAQRSRQAPPPTLPQAVEAERRQLTVLFCDLVDSTALAGQLDPEDLRKVIQAYHATCARVIQRFEGHIAQYLGDGLLVYFGYPRAHEDDAQRAVRAGLGMIEALGMLNERLAQEHTLRLAVRVGIHTGLVVVGRIGGERQEQLALGDTPNIAARLQSLALPDTVVFSAATWQLVQEYFTCRALGPQSLRGVSTALHVYQALGESGVQSRLEAAATRGLTPLVGREAEVALLLARWAEVQEGRGHIIALSGEAGIGKSRLLQVLKDHLTDTPHIRIECRCSPYYQHTAFYPLIEYLERLLHFQRDESIAAKLAKLEQALAQYRLPLSETVPLFAALLSLPLPEARYAPLPLTPERQKQKTLEATLAIVLELAERRPILFILEDLHWADPSTLEFLQLLLAQGPTAALLTVVTYRPDFQTPWDFRTHLTPLALQRLSADQVEAIVMQVTGGKPLPPEVLWHVVTNTDGVPLFVEELTKTIVESGILREAVAHYELTGPLPPLAIPTTLQDALMARLDRLSTVKAVAQQGATIGRTFAYDLLQAVTPLAAAALQHGLQQLVAAELLYQRGVPPQATYRFKHALIQEAAYQSLLRSTRQQYHQRIAQVLETQFLETVETQPEVVAHHCTEAGLIVPAILYWQQAGQRAISRSANIEAISHLTRGLELLQTCPDTPERIQQELTLHLMLGPALMATRGYAAPEVEHTYARARALCMQVEETPQLFPVLVRLRLFYLQRAVFQTAWELSEQCQSLAQHLQAPMRLLEASEGSGTVLFWRGELTQALTHLEEGVRLYATAQHELSIRYRQGSGVTCLTYAALSLWLLGYPDQALHRSQEALTLVCTESRPFLVAYTLTAVVLLHQLRREEHHVQARAEAIITVSREEGFPYFLAIGTIFRGWALAKQGQREEGIAQMPKDSPPTGPRGPRWPSRICWPSSLKRMEQVDNPKKGSRYSTRRWQRCATPESVCTRRNCIDSRGISCGCSRWPMRRKPRPACTRPLRLPTSSRPDPWGCVPP
jgi:class 3 adenylate cyclase